MCRQDSPSSSWAGFLTVSNAVSRTCSSDALWEPGLHDFQPVPTPRPRSTTLHSDWARKKWVSLAAFHIAGEASCSLTCSHFSLWENSWTKKFPLALSCVAMRDKSGAGKVKCYFYSLMHPNLDTFSPTVFWNSPLNSRIATEAFVYGNCPNQFSLGRRWKKTPILPYWWYHSRKDFLIRDTDKHAQKLTTVKGVDK